MYFGFLRYLCYHTCDIYYMNNYCPKCSSSHILCVSSFRMFQPPPKGDNRPVLLMNKPTCSVPPAAQTPKPPPVTEVTSAPAPAPVVQQGKQGMKHP